VLVQREMERWRFARIYEGKTRLLLESFCTTIPELRFVVVRQLDPEQPNAARRHPNPQPQRNARCCSVERDSLYA
jgi:hypothetical protein